LIWQNGQKIKSAQPSSTPNENTTRSLTTAYNNMGSGKSTLLLNWIKRIVLTVAIGAITSVEGYTIAVIMTKPVIEGHATAVFSI
jgi:hypothetical protein